MTDKEKRSCVGTIRTLMSLAYNVHGVMDSVDADNCERIIKCINSISPVAHAEKQQPCEDCISRTEAIKQVGNFYTNCERLKMFQHTANEVKQTVADILSDLPSVTPQKKSTGSWVEKQVVDNEEVEIEQWQSARCSKCDKYHTTPYSYYFDEYSYCPNCGAKMEGEKDGSD